MMNVKNNFSKKPIPVIFGVKSYKLNKKEKKFFQNSNPLGFILFERNCKTFNQTKLLIKDLKNTTSHTHTMIMIKNSECIHCNNLSTSFEYRSQHDPQGQLYI